MNIETVYPKVRAILAETLAIDVNNIVLDNSLTNDLGIESIDFIELIYELELAFDIQIPQGYLKQRLRGSLTPEEFEQDGKLTTAGVACLKENLSEIPDALFPPVIALNDIPTLFTVETLCKIVLEKRMQPAEISE